MADSYRIWGSREFIVNCATEASTGVAHGNVLLYGWIPNLQRSHRANNQAVLAQHFNWHRGSSRCRSSRSVEPLNDDPPSIGIKSHGHVCRADFIVPDIRADTIDARAPRDNLVLTYRIARKECSEEACLSDGGAGPTTPPVTLCDDLLRASSYRAAVPRSMQPDGIIVVPCPCTIRETFDKVNAAIHSRRDTLQFGTKEKL